MGAGGPRSAGERGMTPPSEFEPWVVVLDHDEERAQLITEILRRDYRVTADWKNEWAQLERLLASRHEEGITLVILPEDLSQAGGVPVLCKDEGPIPTLMHSKAT